MPQIRVRHSQGGFAADLPPEIQHVEAKNFQGSILVFRGGIQSWITEVLRSINHQLCWSAFLNMIMRCFLETSKSLLQEGRIQESLHSSAELLTK